MTIRRDANVSVNKSGNIIARCMPRSFGFSDIPPVMDPNAITLYSEIAKPIIIYGPNGQSARDRKCNQKHPFQTPRCKHHIH